MLTGDRAEDSDGYGLTRAERGGIAITRDDRAGAGSRPSRCADGRSLTAADNGAENRAGDGCSANLGCASLPGASPSR